MTVDYLAALVAALLAVTTAGVGVTVVSIVWLMRRQDAAIHTMERDHSAEIAQLQQKHQHETEALRARIFMLESQQAMTLQILQDRNVFLPADVANVQGNGHNDRLYSALRELFSLEQIETLAWEIGIHTDNLGGDALPTVARRLVDEANRAGVSNRLVEAVRKARPNAGV
jgi:hypothetical protein